MSGYPVPMIEGGRSLVAAAIALCALPVPPAIRLYMILAHSDSLLHALQEYRRTHRHETYAAWPDNVMSVEFAYTAIGLAFASLCFVLGLLVFARARGARVGGVVLAGI